MTPVTNITQFDIISNEFKRLEREEIDLLNLLKASPPEIMIELKEGYSARVRDNDLYRDRLLNHPSMTSPVTIIHSEKSV